MSNFPPRRHRDHAVRYYPPGRLFISIMDSLSPRYLIDDSSATYNYLDRFIFQNKSLITIDPPPLNPPNRQMPLPRFDPIVMSNVYHPFFAGGDYWVSEAGDKVVSWLHCSVFIDGNKVLFESKNSTRKILCCFIKNDKLLVIVRHRLDADTVLLTINVFSFDTASNQYTFENATQLADYNLTVELDEITVVAENNADYLYVSAPDIKGETVTVDCYRIEENLSVTNTKTVVYSNAELIGSRTHSGQFSNNTVTETINVNGDNVFCGLFSNVGGVYLLLAATISNDSTKTDMVSSSDNYSLFSGTTAETFNIAKQQHNKIVRLHNGAWQEVDLLIELTNNKSYSRDISGSHSSNARSYTINESASEEYNRLLFYSHADEVLAILNETITHSGTESISENFANNTRQNDCTVATKTDTKVTIYKKGIVFLEIADSNTVESADFIHGFPPKYDDYFHHVEAIFFAAIYPPAQDGATPSNFSYYTNVISYSGDNIGNTDGILTYVYGKLVLEIGDYLYFNNDAMQYSGDGEQTYCISDKELLLINYFSNGKYNQFLVNIENGDKQLFDYNLLKSNDTKMMMPTLTTYNSTIINSTYFNFL